MNFATGLQFLLTCSSRAARQHILEFSESLNPEGVNISIRLLITLLCSFDFQQAFQLLTLKKCVEVWHLSTAPTNSFPTSSLHRKGALSLELLLTRKLADPFFPHQK